MRRFFVYLVALAGVSMMAAAQSPRLLTAAEIQASRPKLDKALVQGIAGPLKVETAQAFEVKVSGGEAVWLEPVRFESKNVEAGNTTNRCGVFFLSKASQAVFLPTVGYGSMEAEQCTSLRAVGFSATGAAAPRVLLLYAAASPNTDLQQPVVLDWSARTGRYELNEVLSGHLEDDAGATSIAGMKKALRKYAAAK